LQKYRSEDLGLKIAKIKDKSDVEKENLELKEKVEELKNYLVRSD